ncbi:MAG: penicillin-binding protein 1A [Burkholderiales bacterium]
MANPRLPPPDDAMDRSRPTSNANREPRLSLREATQQARAVRRAGSSASGASGPIEAGTSGDVGGGGGDVGGGTGRGGGSSGGGGGTGRGGGSGGGSGGGGKPRSRLPQQALDGLPWSRWFAWAFAVASVAGLSLAACLSLAFILAMDRLPTVNALLDYKPKIPLRIYTSDGVLIGEFGEERRSPLRASETPKLMRDAILAAEDSRFFEHHGVDLLGIVRAAIANLISGGKEQGASTITMQLARNFFLSTEKSYIRKIYEVLLAMRIEETLSKTQILELYMNQIYLGQRAYGFASAARVYFNKSLQQLSPIEAALLAGLPKAPSRFNPVVNPKRAAARAHYVLGRMRAEGFLTEAQYRAALNEPIKVVPASAEYPSRAPYVAEMARKMTVDLFRDDTYALGLKVYTTINAAEQQAAELAVRQGILDYDRKYGYRGPESYVELPVNDEGLEEAVDNALDDREDVDDLLAAVVLRADPRQVTVSRGKQGNIIIGPDGLKFAANSLGERAPAARRIRRGAVVRIAALPQGGWEIVQLPDVQAAYVSANRDDGAIHALVGGFDFGRNKFNRVTQAQRQPGSAFKPFIYSAALEKGFHGASVVNDAPISIDPALTGGQVWDPKNYDGKYDGPMQLRTALAKSKNMVSIRLLQSIGTRYAQSWIQRFGFEADKHPPYLTMALGAGSVTPLQLLAGYTVFSNGGYKVDPYLIRTITDREGRLLAAAKPLTAGNESARAISPRNAFLMDSLLHEVAVSGTAAKASASLKRSDLAGKTGTTNDSVDAWFAGYGGDVVAVAWVGFDTPRKLGERETGGGLALPIWIQAVERSLSRSPERRPSAPEGVNLVGNDWQFSDAPAVPGVQP